MGGDGGGLREIDRWPALPVEVETRHRGRVGDPEGGADGAADAVVGERRRCGVVFHDPATFPAAPVDDAVEDQPRGDAGGLPLLRDRRPRRRRGWLPHAVLHLFHADDTAVEIAGSRVRFGMGLWA